MVARYIGKHDKYRKRFHKYDLWVRIKESNIYVHVILKKVNHIIPYSSIKEHHTISYSSMEDFLKDWKVLYYKK